ncbi:MAG TPA: hypothetical protein VMH86_08225 [Rhizomicrobium sp.]|nr:hypothetical protein [Rhizomicrobium sp.]
MTDYPPSRVRVVSHEAISQSEVRIMMEMIVDVHRLAEVGHDFLSQAISQIGAKDGKTE